VTVNGDAAGYKDRGQFTATVDGATFRAATWDGLREQLENLAGGQVAVPFTRVSREPGRDGSYLTDGTARAMHASSYRTALVTWADGTKGTLRNETVVQPLPPQVRIELDQALRNRAALAKRITSIERAHQLDLPKAVEAAMAARVTGT
jgi:hypothetical protein